MVFIGLRCPPAQREERRALIDLNPAALLGEMSTLAKASDRKLFPVNLLFFTQCTP